MAVKDFKPEEAAVLAAQTSQKALAVVRQALRAAGLGSQLREQKMCSQDLNYLNSDFKSGFGLIWTL